MVDIKKVFLNEYCKTFFTQMSHFGTFVIVTLALTAATFPLRSTKTNISVVANSTPGTLEASSNWSKEAAAINLRTPGSGPGVQDDYDDLGVHIWLTRSEEEGTEVISKNGIQYLKTTIADGRNWQNSGYDRSEYSIDYNFVAGQKYVMEWRGMIPQAWPTNGTVTVILQVHMDNGTCPSFEIAAKNGKLTFNDHIDPSIPNQTANFDLKKTFDLGSQTVNVTITYRLTLISSAGADGYVKFEKNGVTIMERSGRTTVTPGGDWLKDGTLYDWGKYWVDPALASRGLSYSLLTEYSRIWKVP